MNVYQKESYNKVTILISSQKYNLSLRYKAVQFLCYATSILLLFDNNPASYVIILQCVFMGLAIIIKFVRQIKGSKMKKIIKCQVSFVIAYMLTGFQLYCYYLALAALSQPQSLWFGMALVLQTNMCYSFLLNEETFNTLELVVYCVGLILHLVMTTKYTAGIIYLFDQLQSDDYEKDMLLLLFTGTGIAVGTLIFDQLLKVYESKEKEAKAEKKNDPSK